MNIFKYKIKKASLNIAIIFSLTFFLPISLLAEEPSRETGGPVLTIDNQTDFTIKFPKGIIALAYPQGITGSIYHYYRASHVSSGSRFDFDPIEPKSSRKLEFSWGGFEYWFGTAGDERNDKLIIGSDNWPEDELLTITLKKERFKDVVKKHQSGYFDPLRREDSKKGKKFTPRINWAADWEGNGWKITLTQIETRTSFVSLEDLKEELK